MKSLSQKQREKYASLHTASDRQYNQRRGSAGVRGYGRAWRQTRDAFIASNPVCSVPGCERPTQEVDHILPRAKGGTDDWSNLQPLCRTHHSMKTARHDGGFGNEVRP